MKSPGAAALSALLSELSDTVEAIARKEVGLELVKSADLFLDLLRERDDELAPSCLLGVSSSRLLKVKIRLLGRVRERDRLPSLLSSPSLFGRSLSFL